MSMSIFAFWTLPLKARDSVRSPGTEITNEGAASALNTGPSPALLLALMDSKGQKHGKSAVGLAWFCYVWDSRGFEGKVPGLSGSPFAPMGLLGFQELEWARYQEREFWAGGNVENTLNGREVGPWEDWCVRMRLCKILKAMGG